MACPFCATGDGGFGRQLSVGEIVEQVVRAGEGGSHPRAAPRPRRLHGDGRAPREHSHGSSPPSNASSAISASRQRHITLSTVGIVPGIRALASQGLQINLAVSLHAANDELRDKLVPVNRRYPLEVLLGACEEYLERTHRRISLEWALMDKVNDSPSDAAELRSRRGASVRTSTSYR